MFRYSVSPEIKLNLFLLCISVTTPCIPLNNCDFLLFLKHMIFSPTVMTSSLFKDLLTLRFKLTLDLLKAHIICSALHKLSSVNMFLLIILTLSPEGNLFGFFPCLI